MNSLFTFVSHTNKPGGAELALRRYLEATALPVRLVTLEGGGVWEGLSAETVTVRSPARLRKALADSDGPVVANSMRAALLSAVSLPRPRKLVYWVRDGLLHSAMSPLALLVTKQVTARRVDRFVANSHWTAGTVVAALGVDRSDVAVLYSPCGVSATTLPAPRHAPRDPLRLLYLGRLARWKGPDVAVRALAALRDLGLDVTLTIAGAAHFGEEAYARDVATLVRSTAGAHMLGHVTDVTSLLADHDLLVHCSTRPEPFGQVLVQAMAAGVPVVASQGGGPSEILEGVPAPVTYPPGDGCALAHAIASAVGHYGQLSEWGLDRVLHFTDAASVSAADALLQEWC